MVVFEVIVLFEVLLPCRYRDPKTGLPYATMAAFKIIRERYTLLLSLELTFFSFWVGTL
uniref:Vps72/YL1 C-terminal domain-containing protein n=1 Tax=Aegilops tauschii subsp. strangulata TaxID=200361 RepID=A0A453S4V4_AEGTS